MLYVLVEYDPFEPAGSEQIQEVVGPFKTKEAAHEYEMYRKHDYFTLKELISPNITLFGRGNEYVLNPG